MRLPLVVPSATAEPRTVWLVRAAVGTAGVGALGYALFGLLTNVPPAQLVGVAAWLAAALLAHDGVVVPMTTLAGGGLSRLSYGLRPAQQGVVRGALLVGFVVTLLVAPLIRAQQVHAAPGQGSDANSTILQANYGQALGLFWLVLVVVAAGVVTAVGLYTRRSSVRKTRP